jgi:hypothetical protein
MGTLQRISCGFQQLGLGILVNFSGFNARAHGMGCRCRSRRNCSRNTCTRVLRRAGALSLGYRCLPRKLNGCVCEREAGAHPS